MTMKHTIGNLARDAGIPASTIRYYEREGLIRPEERTQGNYRVFGREALERLRFIRAAQATGFTLADIKTLLAYRDGKLVPCKDVRILIEKRLANVEERMGELRHVRKILREFLETCRTADQEEPCHVIGRLEPGTDRIRAKNSRGKSGSR
jgi:DNA-binding transcriptional MerR regulator